MIRAELKKMLKTPRVLAVLIFSLLFSLLLSYLPATYEYCRIIQEDQLNEYSGLKALRILKEEDSAVSGEVTPDMLKAAVLEYRNTLTEYGVFSVQDLPEGVYRTYLGRYDHLYHMLREAYADPKTGVPRDLLDLTDHDLERFEEQRTDRFASLMVQEDCPQPVRQKAQEMYSRTAVPLHYYPYFNSNVLDYETLLFFMVMLCGVVIASPVFAGDYESGADDIQRCTKNGMHRLAAAKCTAVLVLVTAMYLAAGTAFFCITKFLYGSEAMASDIQTYLSLFTFEPWTLGELMRYIAAAGYICTVSTVLCTLMLSSKIHTTGAAVGISLLVTALPLLIGTFFSTQITDWLVIMLPSCGLMLQNSFYYAIHALSFMSAGNIAVASERIMTVFELITIPLYVYLMFRSYACRK